MIDLFKVCSSVISEVRKVVGRLIWEYEDEQLSQVNKTRRFTLRQIK